MSKTTPIIPAKTNVTFIRSDSGDWEAAYINGKLVDQGHNLDLATFLDRLGFNVESAELPDNFDKTGDDAPDELEDVFKAYPDLVTE